MSTTQVKVNNPATPHESVASALPDIARTLQSMFDPFGMYASIFQSQQAWAQHPQEWLHQTGRRRRALRRRRMARQSVLRPAQAVVPALYPLDRGGRIRHAGNDQA